MTEKVKTLLINGIVVTMDANFTVYEDGAVAIDGDSIVAVGTTADVTAHYSAR